MCAYRGCRDGLPETLTVAQVGIRSEGLQSGPLARRSTVRKHAARPPFDS